MAIFQFAQADNFGKAGAAVTLILLIAVVVGRHWIARRDERDGAAMGLVLLCVALVATAAVILAAIAGPHPS